MAIRNKIIYNPRTRHSIKFLQTGGDTGGELLEMEATFSAHSKEPAPHFHPFQEEEFTVLSGEITASMDGQPRILKQGDTLHLPRNKVHSMWNHSDEQAVVNWKVRPALNTEHFLETATGLARDGRTNEEGMPPVLQVALMANKFSAVFRLSKPPFFLQRIFFTILLPFAYLSGYRPTYKKYLD